MALTRIELLGTSFTIRSQEDEAYFKDVVAYFRKRVEEAAGKNAIVDPLKVSILVALNVVDELFKERIASGAAAEDARQAGEVTTRMISRIDRALHQAARGPSPAAAPPSPAAMPRSPAPPSLSPTPASPAAMPASRAAAPSAPPQANASPPPPAAIPSPPAVPPSPSG